MTIPRHLKIMIALLLALASCKHVSSNTGGPADYEAAFITDRIVTWNITIDDTAWNGLLTAPEI